jgi:hypothetical protein
MDPTRRAVMLAALATAVLVVLTAVGVMWFWPQPAPSQAALKDPPAAAARDFLAAIKRKDCERAWTYFSAGSQAHIERESENRIQQEPYYAESFAPKNLYCRPTYAHRFNSYDAESVRLLSESGGRATVGADRHVAAGFRMPGFFPSRTEIHPAEMELVEEAGAWKIAIPERETLHTRPRRYGRERRLRRPAIRRRKRMVPRLPPVGATMALPKPTPALSRELLRRLRARPGRAQYRGGVSWEVNAGAGTARAQLVILKMLVRNALS